MNTSLPAAVLLDFDGTLVDTEPYWMQGEFDLLGSYGVPWDDERSQQLCGTSKEVSLEVLLGQMASHGVDTSKIDSEEFYEALSQLVIDRIERLGAPWLPGVPALLADLKAHAMPCAVVSSSPAGVLEAGLEKFPDGVISIVVNGQSVANSKPSPDGYLLAAQLLGVDARDCVVLEDTVSGTAAGRASGAVVIAVPRLYELPDEPGQVVVPNLEGFDVAKLRELFAQVRGTTS